MHGACRGLLSDAASSSVQQNSHRIARQPVGRPTVVVGAGGWWWLVVVGGGWWWLVVAGGVGAGGGHSDTVCRWQQKVSGVAVVPVAAVCLVVLFAPSS